MEARGLYNEPSSQNLARAIELNEKALEIDPNFADAWAGLSLALNRSSLLGTSWQDVRERCFNAADSALALAPESWMANLAKAAALSSPYEEQFFAAQPHFEKSLADNPNAFEVQQLYSFALFQQGRSDEALPHWLAIYRRDPLSAMPNLFRASASALLGERDMVAVYIDRALSMGTPTLDILDTAARIYNVAGNIRDSVPLYLKVLALDPTHYSTVLSLGSAAWSLGDLVATQQWFDYATFLEPENADLLWRKADFLALTGRLDELTPMVESWIEREPDNAHAVRWSGYLPMWYARQAYQREDSEEVRRQSQAALQQQMSYIALSRTEDGVQVQFWNSWSVLTAAENALVLGEDELAQDFYQRIIDFYANQKSLANVAFRDSQLAIAHAGLGQPELVIHYLNQLYEGGYNTTWVFDSLGLFKDQIGLFNDIRRNVGVRDFQLKMQARHKDALEYFRQQHPDFFEPQIFKEKGLKKKRT